MLILKAFSKVKLYLLTLLLLLPIIAAAEVVVIENVPPTDGVAYITPGDISTPDIIINKSMSGDQNLVSLLDNNGDTFYQPAAGSNAPSIGSDILLDFDFSMIPDEAEIIQVAIGVEVSSTDSDDPYTRGFGLAAYNRTDLSQYLEINIGPPGTTGVFLIGTGTPAFFVPGLHTIPVPKGVVFKLHLNHNELTVDNVRNLSVALLGINSYYYF